MTLLGPFLNRTAVSLTQEEKCLLVRKLANTNPNRYSGCTFRNFFKYFFCSQGPVYNIWQDAGIRTRVASTAAKFTTNEVHTSLKLN